MKKIFTIAAVLLSASVGLSAQDETAMTDGETALDFIRFDQNPATAAMGGANLLSTTTMAWGAFANPAAVPFSSKRGDVAFSYQNWGPSRTSYATLGMGFSIKEKVGLSWGVNAGFDSVQTASSEEGEGASFRPLDLQACLGISYRFVPWVSVGASVRYASQRLVKEYTLSAISANAFVMGEYRGARLVVGITDMGSKASYENKPDVPDKYPVPGAVSFAVGYSNTFAEKHSVEAEVDGHYILAARTMVMSFGAGYKFGDYAAVRAGYCYGGKFMPSYATIGLGTGFKGVHIDACYVLAAKTSPMARTFSVALGVAF